MITAGWVNGQRTQASSGYIGKFTDNEKVERISLVIAKWLALPGSVKAEFFT